MQSRSRLWWGLAGIGWGAAATLAPPAAGAAGGTEIALIARFHPTPGREDELELRLRELVVFTRGAMPGYVGRLHRSGSGDQTAFVLYEAYPSQSAFLNHVSVTMAAWRRQFGPLPGAMMRRPFEMESLDPLGD